MSTLPPLAKRDRVIDAILVVGLGVAQAAALAVAAFATRDAFAALHSGNHLSWVTVFELGISGIVAALCLFLSRRGAEAIGQSYAIDLRRSLYRKIARLPKVQHEARRLGSLSLRFVGDLSAARLWFGRGLPNVMTASVVLPGALVILVFLDTRLAIFGLLPLCFALIAVCGVAWRLENRHRQLRSRRAHIAIAMIERIAIAPELDLMGRTDKELRALDEQGQGLKERAVARRGRTAGLQAILQLGTALSALTMLCLANANGTSPATVAASLSVLALVTMPLQDLAAAWDHYCGWRVAREKANRLLNEPAVERRAGKGRKAASVSVKGYLGDEHVAHTVEAGKIAKWSGPNGPFLARLVAGLDRCQDVEVSFPEHSRMPRVSYIGDTHIGLQGSLRRAATLNSRKRPCDEQILSTLKAFGLKDLVSRPGSLDQRLAANGKCLSSSQTLRLDLARAVLGQASVVVIASLRWSADPERTKLLGTLHRQTTATIIVTDVSSDHHHLAEDPKAI